MKIQASRIELVIIPMIMAVIIFYVWPAPPVRELGDRVIYQNQEVEICGVGYVNNMTYIFLPRRYQWSNDYLIRLPSGDTRRVQPNELE